MELLTVDRRQDTTGGYGVAIDRAGHNLPRHRRLALNRCMLDYELYVQQYLVPVLPPKRVVIVVMAVIIYLVVYSRSWINC